MAFTFSKYQWTEGLLHLLFWVFIFSAVNVSWQQDWFDTSIRPNTPSPLSVIIFPLLFYTHAYWAIPNYLFTKKWLIYGLSLLLIFAGPELMRLAFYAIVLDRPIGLEISSRDSFLMGSIDVAWIAFIFSLVYRLLFDSIMADVPKKSDGGVKGETSTPFANFSTEEIQQIEDALTGLMKSKQLFLQEDLNLGKLSESLGITDKKLSTLLNQYMDTNFTDYVNAYRIHHFIKEVEAGKLQQLSIMGLANQSGFSSKSTFYRAFKKIRGCTPSDFLNSKE